jgi:DNA-binding XRE family transcriptional regulator
MSKPNKMQTIKVIMLNSNIHQILQEKNMTLDDLAQNACVKTTYLNYIIDGVAIPTLPIAIRIAKALSKRVEDVFVLE